MHPTPCSSVDRLPYQGRLIRATVSHEPFRVYSRASGFRFCRVARFLGFGGKSGGPTTTASPRLVWAPGRRSLEFAGSSGFRV